MNSAFKILIVFISLCLLLLGSVFLIAGGQAANYLTGGAMLLVALALLGYVHLMNRTEAQRPIHQEFHVTMGGSGELKEMKIKCRSCGAGLEQKDVKVVSGGLTVKCPYCATVYALEEEPKW